MMNTIVIESEVGEDGKLSIQLPPGAPRGRVHVTIQLTAEATAHRMTPEEEAALDAEFEALMNDPTTFTGLGLTAEELSMKPTTPQRDENG
jgi:hypothetical protein